MTDIHWPDGTASWIEAQRPDAAGIDTMIHLLDGSGDGIVTYFDGVHVDGTSDGNKRVEVYPDRAAAEAAGCNIPGN